MEFALEASLDVVLYIVFSCLHKVFSYTHQAICIDIGLKVCKAQFFLL